MLRHLVQGACYNLSDGLQFRGKIKAAVDVAIIDWLLTKPVAAKCKFTVAPVPNSERKHSVCRVTSFATP